MDVQHIELAGQPFVLLPKADFERMAKLGEMADDVAAFDAIIAARNPNAEGIPLAFAEQLFAAHDAGESVIPLWRKYRGLTQAALAEAAGITQAYVSDIEAGKKEGSVSVLKNVAAVLACDLDDLV